MAGGRPTKYTPELLEKAGLYLEEWDKEGDVIPTKCALCISLDIARDTANEWKNHKDKKQFSDILKKLEAKQRQVLCNSGLSGKFNSVMAKLMLSKHGVVEKTESAHTGKGGGTLVIKNTLGDDLTEMITRYVKKN